MANKGWLVHKGVYSNHSDKWNMVSRQRDALERAGVDFDFIDVVEASDRLARIERGIEAAPPWALFRNPDMSMRQSLEMLGTLCINSVETANICRDKFLTSVFCAKHRIAHPITLKVPAIDMSCEQKQRFIDEAEKTIGYPAIVKGIHGSGGQGIVMARSREELAAAIPDVNRNRIVQQFVDTSWGRDARMFIVDGKVVFAHERVNTDGDFKSNTTTGGHCLTYDVTDSELAMAEKIGALLPMSSISVDIIWDDDGEPILCEMNGNPDFSDLDDKMFSTPVFEDSIAEMICKIDNKRKR